jgi:transposase InsO family protein
LEVSSSGYYAWKKRDESRRQQEDKQLSTAIEEVFRASRETYGSNRVRFALRQNGIYTSRKRVARLMRQCGLRSVRNKWRNQGLTQAVSNGYVVENLLKQDFTASRQQPKWVSDTTYIPTQEGWLYLVTVLDLESRAIVGWAMGDHHDAQLATTALEMALHHHRPRAGLILHTDRGGEFANAQYAQTAAQAKIRRSMSGSGNCYDNAVAESFFASLKLEALHGQIYASKRAARSALFDYIEVFYNRQRLHSSLGFVSPSAFIA